MNKQKQEINQDWPASATWNGSRLKFGGNFMPARLLYETFKQQLKKLGDICVAFFIALGTASLIFSLWANWGQNNWHFLLNRDVLSLAFYVGGFFALYFWAQTQQKIIEEQKLNFLEWEDPDSKKIPPTELDVYAFFSADAKQCWHNAAIMAEQNRRQNSASEINVTAINLMLALIDDRSVQSLFYRLGIDFNDIGLFLKNYSQLVQNGSAQELRQLPFTAFNEAIKLRNKNIDPLMLLCALKLDLPENHVLQGIFFNLNISLDDLETACAWVFNLQLLREQVKTTFRLSRFKPSPETNRGLTSLPTPYLNRFSRDLTQAARYGQLPLALGRERDLAEVLKLLGANRANLLVKGPPGTGRATLFNALAYRMAAEQVPNTLSDMRLVELNTSAILGNEQKAEQVLIKCLQEALHTDNIIFYISNLHELARVQTSTGISLLEVLIDFIKNYDLTILATSTNEDYTDYLRRFPDFDSVFASYELKTLNKTEILLACCVQASLMEQHNRCLFNYHAIKQAVELTDLYIKDGGQPQKAIGVLVEAASRIKSQKRRLITPRLIQTIVSEKTHIPEQTLTQDESGKLLNLESELGKYIIGQRDALVAVAEGLRRARSGLSSDNRPLGSFLFLGPTGVGKTEVAKTLASIYFGEEKFLLRLDMSEYQGQEGLQKLIGSENSKTDSPMVKHLKNYPFCLLLLDEFEKASPQVLNLFLQVLEDGRITSGKGETVDLTHCLIIATSNAGSVDIQNGIKAKESLDLIKAKLLDQSLQKYYPPELLNRFDGVIIFSPLSPDEVAAIVHLQLETLKKQMLAKGIIVDFSQAVARDIAEKAYEPSLGARPVRRYIQDHIETFVAKLILQKSIQRGSEVQIDLQDGKLILLV